MDEGLSKKRGAHISGRLKNYMRWPIAMAIMLLLLNLWIYCIDIKAGTLMLIFMLIYIVGIGILYVYSRSLIMKDLIEFAAQYGVVQNTLLKELSVPYAILLEDGQLLWMNDQFERLFGDTAQKDKYLSRYIPELNRSIFPKEENDVVEMDVYYEDREYKAELRRVSVEGFSETEQLLELPAEREYFIAVYLQDVTELNRYIKENEEQRLVAGLIYIDNYDEVMNSVEEVRQSLLVALVDRKINQYIAKADGIVKKTETDKYFIALKKQEFKRLEDDKFSLLEDVKTVNIGNDMAVTLSIGIGMNGESYAQNYDYARTSIDMALGRGGDQAVVKDSDKILYYGGKAQQMEKTTRVKARVKAHALKELMDNKDRLLIMGHRMADIDAFGAAVGIYRIAMSMNKKANIVLNDVTSSVRPMMERFQNNPEYPDDMFLNGAKAAELVDAGTMLVVVDVNRPSITDEPSLLRLIRTIVVLDHHRTSSEVIDNAVLSYVEPYASSACEMVAEVLQYIADGIKVRPCEADAMYAGIVIDTQNFTNQTGVRTFEAAAFLRRCGADITRVRKRRGCNKSAQAVP